jgi:hypothetical protein
MDEKNSQKNTTQLLNDNLDNVEKFLEKQKLYSYLNSVIATRNLTSITTRLLEEIKQIVMKYYPVDREFVDVQSALVYLLEERVDEIQNLSVECDTLQEQLDMFKNKEI